MVGNTKWLALVAISFSAVALATDSPPPGYRIDNTDSKGTKIGDIVDGVHRTFAVEAGRAEWRCDPNNGACSTRTGIISFQKQVKINGGANISLAQFLNIKGSGTSGGSEPISQLTVDDQSNGTYRVSIEQDDYPCGFRVPKNTWMSFEAGIARNGTGWFKIDGQYCQRPANSGVDRYAGNPKVDEYSGDNTYYLKYGAYNAAGNNTASSVSWR